MGHAFDQVGRVFELIDRLDGLPDGRAVLAMVAATLAEFGFTAVIVTRLPQPRRRLHGYALLHSYPSGWLRRYDQAGYYADDPVATQCFASTRPFAWTDVARLQPETDRTRRIMGEAADAGLKVGFTVPITDLDGFQAAVTMAGAAAEVPPDTLKALHLLGYAAFAAAERRSGLPNRGTRGPSLSPRERDVLVWLSTGLTNAGVAETLRLRVPTVEGYIKSAREKLGAVNALHAVVEAVRLKQIRL